MMGCKPQLLAHGLPEEITRLPVGMNMIVNRDGGEDVSVFLTRPGSPALLCSYEYENENGNFKPPLINVGVGHDVTIQALAEIIQAGWCSTTRLVDGLKSAHAKFSAVMT
jgi:hypothetical protein